MNFRKMLIGNARKAMLDNITALDKKTLQKELESHLKLEFEYKDEIERLNHECDTYLKIATKRKHIIDELEKLIDSYELGKYDYEIPVVILKDKLKELKEGKK